MTLSQHNDCCGMFSAAQRVASQGDYPVLPMRINADGLFQRKTRVRAGTVAFTSNERSDSQNYGGKRF